MYFVGNNISKYKHDCFILTETGGIVSNSFTIMNNQDGFQSLLTILNSLDNQDEIRIGFYHTYSLKSLTRLRDTLVKQRSFYIVKITNVLDHTFPEFKPFFGNRFSKTHFQRGAFLSVRDTAPTERKPAPLIIICYSDLSHSDLHSANHLFHSDQ